MYDLEEVNRDKMELVFTVELGDVIGLLELKRNDHHCANPRNSLQASNFHGGVFNPFSPSSWPNKQTILLSEKF